MLYEDVDLKLLVIYFTACDNLQSFDDLFVVESQIRSSVGTVYALYFIYFNTQPKVQDINLT